jgi:predicted dehydrogenase
VPLHAQLIRPVLESKKDIFVEWPLAANLKEAEELTALAKAQGVKTLVGLQARQDPSVRKAREIVQSGELGEILGTTLLGAVEIWQDSVPTSFEYSLPIENGANLFTIPAGHALDALCYVLGEFKDLQATLVNNRSKVPVVDARGNVLRTAEKTSHDWLSVNGNLVNGGVATIVYQAASSLTGKNFYWEINGTKGTLVLEGPAAHVQMFHPTLKIVKAREKGAKLEEVKVDASPKLDFTFNVGKAWDAFVGQGDGHLTTFEDALLRHKMIDAIYRSNESGKRESYI